MDSNFHMDDKQNNRYGLVVLIGFIQFALIFAKTISLVDWSLWIILLPIRWAIIGAISIILYNRSKLNEEYKD